MDRIVFALFKCGPMSEKEILDTVGLLYSKPSIQRQAITRSINAGWMNERAGKYTLNAWLVELVAARYENKPAPTRNVITPPPYHPPFKPLSSSMYAGVQEKVREVSFKTGSIGFPVGYLA